MPVNIAEGAARGSKKEFAQFLIIARGSLSELETLTEISADIGYLKPDARKALLDSADQVSKLLSGLLRTLRQG
ncbi:MAG: four helix bundle protein [Acidobacteriota bacterium]